MDRYYYFHKLYRIWMHRTPLKRLVNPVLRRIQFWTMKPYVIASNTVFDTEGKPHFRGYSICRVEYMKGKVDEEYLIPASEFNKEMTNGI